MFYNWKRAYYLETCLQITILSNTYIIIEIDYMFSNWKQAYYLETCLQITINLNTYNVMEIENMFLSLEIRILSRNMFTDFSAHKNVYYNGNQLHVCIIRNMHIYS